MKRKISTAFIILLACVGPAFSQASASLIVRVIDSRGSSVAGATVKIQARDTQTRKQAVTGSDGSHRFERLAPSEYLVEVESPGFARAAQRIALTGGPAATLEVTLEPAGVSTDVVVIASGTAQTADEVSKAVSVITADEIERRDEFSIPEALRSAPGLQVQQLGGPGAFTAIKIRGLRNEDTAVLIDGFRFRDAAAPQGDASGFLEDLIVVNTDRLEVLRGSGSSLYGTNAIGGVINIVTGEGGGPRHGSLQLEGGSLGLFRGRASFAGGAAADRFSYSAGVAHLNVSRGVDRNDAARTTSGQLRLQYSFTPSLSLAGRIFTADSFVQLNDSPRAVPNQPPTPPPIRAIPLPLDQQRLYEAGQPFNVGNATYIPAPDDPDSTRSGRFFAGALTLAHRLNERAAYRLSYSRVSTDRIFRDGPGGVDPFEPRASTRTDLDGATDTLQARADLRLGRFSFVTAGYEFEREWFHSRSLDPQTDTTARVTQRSHTLFAQDQLRLFDNRLQVSVAGRAQAFDLSQPTFTPAASSPYATVRVEAPPTAYTGDASVAYFINRWGTKLRGHAGSGYRAPTAYERFGSSFFAGFFSFYGDPRLRPERSIAFDAGVDQALFSNRLRASATYFYTRLQEIIIFDFTGGIDPAVDPFGRFGGYRNTGGGLARGLEVSLMAAPTRTLDLLAAYTYTNADARNPNETGTTRLLGLSDHIFTLQANQRIGRFDITADFIAYSQYAAPVSGRAYLFKGPARLDLGASYTLPVSDSTTIRFYGKADNLLDREYFENGFRTPGRVCVAGATLHF
jgi:iron complex outermembrane receptor protein